MINVKNMINVKEYIENEMYYIEKYDSEKSKKDLEYLESLTDKDIDKIQKQVEEDTDLEIEIQALIDGTIHAYLYKD